MEKEEVIGAIDQVEDVTDRAQSAARFAEFEKSLTFVQATKLYWRSCLWVLYGMLLVVNFGMDQIISGSALAVPRFRQDFGKAFDYGNGVTIYIITATWLSVFSGVAQAAAIVGTFSTGYLADKIGRKYTAALSCIISIGGVAAQFFANGSLPILTVGKAINGISIGMWLVIGPLYAGEVAPYRLRGVLTGMTNVAVQLGVLIFTGVFYQTGTGLSRGSYLVPFACQWIIPGLILVTFLVWPESPVWLVRVNRREAAIKAIRSLHGSTSAIDRDGILAQIEETLALEKEEDKSDKAASYQECFNKLHRRRTFAVMFVYCCQYLGASTFIIGYGPYFYQIIGYSAHTALLLGFTFTAFCFATIVIASICVAALPRRPFIVWGQLIAAACLVIIGGVSIAENSKSNIAVIVFIFVWVSPDLFVVVWRFTTVRLIFTTGFHIPDVYRHGCLHGCSRDPCLAPASTYTRHWRGRPHVLDMGHVLRPPIHVQSRCGQLAR